MEESVPAGFDVDPEFMKEGMANLGRPRQKFAPYTKTERQKRRKEVYRLHFELGIPAIGIADAMSVDRNTINNDIQLLYKELGKETGQIDFPGYLGKQMARLESQRGRLIDYLEKEQSVEKKLATERMIADIDFRLMTTLAKIEYGHTKFWDEVYKKFNEVAAKKGLNYRATTAFELASISEKARKKLDELKKE
jgi:hypothetical protein